MQKALVTIFLLGLSPCMLSDSKEERADKERPQGVRGLRMQIRIDYCLRYGNAVATTPWTEGTTK
jgi:hypothetical protein